MTLKFAADSSGAMLAVGIPPDVASRIALDGGELADQLHITLFYFYADADLSDRQRQDILNITQAIAFQYYNIPIVLSGTEVFEDNPDRPLVALVKSPDLEACRKKLALSLDLAGIVYSKDHDYKPHVTLKYLVDGAIPSLIVSETFSTNVIEAWFAGKRIPIPCKHSKALHRLQTFQAKPGGQKQRIGSGDWEQATNRQQRRLTKAYDEWSAKIRRELVEAYRRGSSIPDQTAMLERSLGSLQAKMDTILEGGVDKAAKASAGSRVDTSEVKGLIEKHKRDNRALVATAMIPVIFARLAPEIARGLARDPAMLRAPFMAVRSFPPQYAGNFWVMIFDTQKVLGQSREQERKQQGLKPEPIHWVLDPRAEHCKPSPGYYGCPDLAKEYASWNDLITVPAGQVTCRGNCRCHLEVYRDGQWRRGVYD